MHVFTLRSARAPAVVAGLTLALGVEALAVHLLLAARHPVWAWASTIVSAATVAWLVADDRAFQRATVTVTSEAVTIALGRRWRAVLPRADLADAAPFDWRPVPRTSPDYRNLTKPAQPNVLLTLHEPAMLRGPGGVRVRARRLGLRVDQSEAFLASLAAPETGRERGPAGT